MSKLAPVVVRGKIVSRTPKANDADRLGNGLRQVAELFTNGEEWLRPIYERLEAEYVDRNSLTSVLERAQLILNDNAELIENKIISQAR